MYSIMQLFNWNEMTICNLHSSLAQRTSMFLKARTTTPKKDKGGVLKLFLTWLLLL